MRRHFLWAQTGNLGRLQRLGASGGRARLIARTTASPISRVGTSIGKAGRSLAELNYWRCPGSLLDGVVGVDGLVDSYEVHVSLNATDLLVCFVAPLGYAECSTAPETVDQQPLFRVPVRTLRPATRAAAQQDEGATGNVVDLEALGEV